MMITGSTVDSGINIIITNFIFILPSSVLVDNCSCNKTELALFPIRKMLFTGTVPVNKEHLTGTVNVSKEHLTGTVPVNKKHLTGTLKN